MLTVDVSNHGVLYAIVISMTRRFRKIVGPFICQFVTNRNAYSIVNSNWLILISGERAGHPLQENKAMFLKYIFQ